MWKENILRFIIRIKECSWFQSQPVHQLTATEADIKEGKSSLPWVLARVPLTSQASRSQPRGRTCGQHRLYSSSEGCRRKQVSSWTCTPFYLPVSPGLFPPSLSLCFCSYPSWPSFFNGCHADSRAQHLRAPVL